MALLENLCLQCLFAKDTWEQVKQEGQLIKGGPDVYGVEPLEGKKREFSTEKLQASPVVIQIKEEMELRVCESQSFLFLMLVFSKCLSLICFI